MNTTAKIHNPGFLSDDELVASFCIRTHEFESLMETLRDCTGSSNVHQLVMGPRGSGKTTLLLRVAAEIRRDVGLSSRFFPVVFPEESYEVSTAGEFWLECLSRLADQAPRHEDGPDLHLTFQDLRHIRDDRTLADRCIGALQSFSDQEGIRLVAVVENLNAMFQGIADTRAGWRIRHTLQTDPRFILLASATGRFQEIDNPKRALYQQFRELTLRPLESKECEVLWQSVSGRPRPPETIRALRILTGGIPRLLTILARVSGNLSSDRLMADLLYLVDEHTEYFRSHLDAMPQQERRVYLALASLWKPATTREIADRARLDTSKCSAQLARLVEKGPVKVAGGTARRKLYYVAERLYNIYYLLRRSRGSVPRIENLILFMEGYYSPEAAIAASDRRLETDGNERLRYEMRSHMIRAQAYPIEGDRAACKQDIEAFLTILPRLTSLRKDGIDDLCRLAVVLGFDSMLALIEASPAASLLLPLSTALAKELGAEPRVAREVEDIAEDIRRDLKRHTRELSTE
ncbi:MAG: hypothetical protein OXQ89_04900 [Rhodospirillaceae bacterium]|nr:hypothetical protein [Rhodospirillaceae bacterium]MDE0362936.1 hypothetical protein [Rhodospirillaceae bacterium]